MSTNSPGCHRDQRYRLGPPMLIAIAWHRHLPAAEAVPPGRLPDGVGAVARHAGTR